MPISIPSEEEATPRAERLPRRNFLPLREVADLRGITRAGALHAVRTGALRAHRAAGRREWLVHVEEARGYLERFPPRGAGC